MADQAGLEPSRDYLDGDSFMSGGQRYFTAKLLGDPIALTIRVIDALGYRTRSGIPRWTYIEMPKFVWDSLTPELKRDVIGYHYQHEGGETMRHLFPNWGKP